MNDINTLKNILLTAKEALKFYSDRNNYLPEKKNNDQINVLMDGGHQANYALNVIDHVMKSVAEEESKYDDYAFQHENQPSVDEIKKMLDDLKGVENEYWKK